MTGKKRSWPKSPNHVCGASGGPSMFDDPFYDIMVSNVRSRINEPDVDLSRQLFRLKVALSGKSEYKEKLAKHRKSLRSLVKKIKKKEAEMKRKEEEEAERKEKEEAEILEISKEKEEAEMKRKEEEEAEMKEKEEAEILKKSKEKKEAKIQKKKMKKKEAKFRKQAAKKVC